MNGFSSGKALTRRDFVRTSGAALIAGAASTAIAAQKGTAPPQEARFYTRGPGGTVKCHMCPWGCTVPPGGRGRCGVRENRSGNYYSLVYGRVVARNNDPIEKKPLFHVYPGSRAFSIATVGCNIHCKFCQNWEISQADPGKTSAPYLPPRDVPRLASKHAPKPRTIAYTYNEPTVFSEYMIDCAKAARDQGFGNVMISNGFISRQPLQELCSLMTAVKIDLKAFSGEFYKKMCSARLKPVLRSLKQLAESDTWLEIVVLVIPTLNDNMDEIKAMAAWIAKELGPEVPVHFTRFHPQYRLRNLPPTPIATLQEARKTAMSEGCHFVYTGNTPDRKAANTYCPDCGKRLVKRYRMFLMSNTLKQNRCHECGARIPGVWA